MGLLNLLSTVLCRLGIYISKKSGQAGVTYVIHLREATEATMMSSEIF